jgi:hypothetical protein
METELPMPLLAVGHQTLYNLKGTTPHKYTFTIWKWIAHFSSSHNNYYEGKGKVYTDIKHIKSQKHWLMKSTSQRATGQWISNKGLYSWSEFQPPSMKTPTKEHINKHKIPVGDKNNMSDLWRSLYRTSPNHFFVGWRSLRWPMD